MEPDTTAAEAEPADVHRLEIDGRTLILVGTAHISQESVDLVHRVIDEERPDCVCVELDQQRFEALQQKRRWEDLDLRQVIRERQLATLLVNLLLSSYQKRLGAKLGVMPGSELLEATKLAEKLEIPVALCDREIRITLRRAWGALSLWKKAALLSSIFATSFDTPELSEEELRRIRKHDVLNEMMQELGRAMPDLKRVLIDERDGYLAQKIRDTEGNKLVAVVGAGHVSGMKALLERGERPDMDEITRIPPVSGWWKAFGWAITALILGSIGWIGWTQGAAEAGDNALYWFLANGIPSAIGCAIALGHPVTVVAAFLAAPFTSLTPLIGAGYVTAFVQTYLLPPRVKEFQAVGEEINSIGRWWSNRLLRIFLVFALTGLGSFIGTWVGGVEIVSNLF